MYDFKGRRKATAFLCEAMAGGRHGERSEANSIAQKLLHLRKLFDHKLSLLGAVCVTEEFASLRSQ
ncbi:MAG: hypothetical protein EOP50_01370 [Sphingobacteriales bacterium]|nr:MAG: hypothetical protein EOP50_01370 [Sphingobacteriales bacterium]